MPKVQKTFRGSKSHSSFPVRKGPSRPKTAGKGSPKKDAPPSRSNSGTELRVRKPGSLTQIPVKLEPVAAGPDPNKEEHMRILSQFDLSYKFGPCGGMSRLERWNRAEKFKKNPPPEVKALVESHSDDIEYTQGIWFTSCKEAI
ncbi:hypothetical protein BV898_18581 [Hypsibius exemplaris]|uniref:DNA polymerase delta subunit 4 n=1 Tax=Hypsibius exemplaris TaxID=2072580 RepID=A0A9X6NJY5_HYPEX|nr:hypothetical protein BV898_18581 [Hypsibius exemplaris]